MGLNLLKVCVCLNNDQFATSKLKICHFSQLSFLDIFLMLSSSFTPGPHVGSFFPQGFFNAPSPDAIILLL